MRPQTLSTAQIKKLGILLFGGFFLIIAVVFVAGKFRNEPQDPDTELFDLSEVEFENPLPETNDFFPMEETPESSANIADSNPAASSSSDLVNNQPPETSSLPTQPLNDSTIELSKNYPAPEAGQNTESAPSKNLETPPTLEKVASNEAKKPSSGNLSHQPLPTAPTESDSPELSSVTPQPTTPASTPEKLALEIPISPPTPGDMPNVNSQPLAENTSQASTSENPIANTSLPLSPTTEETPPAQAQKSTSPSKSTREPASTTRQESPAHDTTPYRPAVVPEMVTLIKQPADSLLLKRSKYYVSISEFNHFLAANELPLLLESEGTNIAQVSFELARTFPAWLTDEHRAASIIGNDVHYRLPRYAESPARNIWLQDASEEYQAITPRPVGIVLARGEKP